MGKTMKCAWWGVSFIIVGFLLGGAAMADHGQGSCPELFSNRDFPIEKYYLHPPIKKIEHSSGRVEVRFSKYSKAFIMWRARSSPDVPDSAFALHYLSDEDGFRYLMSLNSGRPASANNGPSEERVLQKGSVPLILPEGLSNTAWLLEDFFAAIVNGDIGIENSLPDYKVHMNGAKYVILQAYNDPDSIYIIIQEAIVLHKGVRQKVMDHNNEQFNFLAKGEIYIDDTLDSLQIWHQETCTFTKTSKVADYSRIVLEETLRSINPKVKIEVTYF